VLAPVDFVAIPDPPDAAAAAIALQDFLARPKGARLHCASPYTGVFIFYDGRVFPCCHPHAHTKLPMGNLLKQEFDEIWNGRAYRNLRAGLKLGDPPPICQRCSIVHGPSENMEQAGPDEGEGADLASYYGALDLDPRDPKEDDELLARIGVPGAAERISSGSHVRETAASHVRSVERELVPLRAHTQAVEESLLKLHRHASDLQLERDALVGHARNLEGELRPLREHSKTIEEILLKLHRHAGDVEHERDALVGHARNLESELRPLREHTKTIEEMLLKLHRHSGDLEHERDALVGHCRNLEAEREAMFGHIKNLEHILRKGFGMAIYRLRCKIGVALGIGQKPKPKS